MSSLYLVTLRCKMWKWQKHWGHCRNMSARRLTTFQWSWIGVCKLPARVPILSDCWPSRKDSAYCCWVGSLASDSSYCWMYLHRQMYQSLPAIYKSSVFVPSNWKMIKSLAFPAQNLLQFKRPGQSIYRAVAEQADATDRDINFAFSIASTVHEICKSPDHSHRMLLLCTICSLYRQDRLW